MEANKRRAKLDQINQKMEDLKEAIKEQRGLYENEIATWKANAFKKLEEEKEQMIKNIPDSYKEYAALYDKEFAQLQKEEIALYKDLIHETIENFKKTAPNDYESKKTFLSILFYLTALKGSGWNKNNFITGEDRNYIKTFLYNNIAQKKNICTGYTKTEPVYNSPSSVGLYGGSPSAGKMFDNQWAKHVDGKTEFILNNPNECEIAISSLIPYANLDGDGYVISNFIREYWNQPMFGAILSYAVKAMAITKVRGKEALGKFIDEAIKKENEVRNSHNGFWETMNLLTMEGLSNSAMYDGKYCEHNLCLSADGGYDQPNVWEGVAEILLNEGFTDILKKVTDQCYITAPNGDYRQQYLKCGGIYPLLFGTLLYAPQLADSLKSKRPYSQQPGQEIDRYGHINYVSAEQAKSNKKANDNYDLLHKYGKAELMMDYIMGQSFEGMHPANKMRMTNLISKSEYRDILDPKHRINTYNADSKIYKKELNKYNAKQVVWGFIS